MRFARQMIIMNYHCAISISLDCLPWGRKGAFSGTPGVLLCRRVGQRVKSLSARVVSAFVWASAPTQLRAQLLLCSS